MPSYSFDYDSLVPMSLWHSPETKATRSPFPQRRTQQTKGPPRKNTSVTRTKARELGTISSRPDARKVYPWLAWPGLDPQSLGCHHTRSVNSQASNPWEKRKKISAKKLDKNPVTVTNWPCAWCKSDEGATIQSATSSYMLCTAVPSPDFWHRSGQCSTLQPLIPIPEQGMVRLWELRGV